MLRNVIKNSSYIFYFISFISCYLSHSQTLTWQQTNGPLGGVWVNDIYVSAQNHIFIATDLAGVYFSSDQGNEWQNIGLKNLFVYSIVQKDNGDLFAGVTGGIYRSVDSGITWEKVLPLGTGVHKIAVNSRGDLFAGAGLQDYPTADGRLFRSIDNGETWERKENGLGGQWVSDILILENDDLFLSVFAEIPNRYVGIYLSQNDGESWQQILSGQRISSLCLSDGMEIFAAGDKTVFVSSDSGKVWREIYHGLDSTYVHFVASDLDGGVYAGTRNGIYKWINSTWVSHNTGMEQISAYTMVSDSKGFLYAGTIQNGMYRSSNGGQEWQPVNTGIIASKVPVILAKYTLDSRIFVGTQGIGLFFSDDRGQTWVKSSLNTETIKSISQNKQGVLFACAGGYHRAYRSYDNGLTWENIGIDSAAIISILPLFDATVLAGTFNGVYKSENNGTTWARVAFPDGLVKNLTWSPSGKIFAGLYSQGDGWVIESDDFGNSWKKTVFNEMTSAIAVNDRGDVYLGFSYGKNLFRSADGGISWEELKPIDTNIFVSSIVCNGSDELYVGTNRGVYLSEDRGDSWKQLNSGIGETFILSLDVDSDGFLYAGTEAAGVYRSVNPIHVKESGVSSFVLNQNYPNPFNAKTTIYFFLFNPGIVNIKIYDLSGREIAVLANRKFSSGHHRLEWDVSLLPSNIYFVQVKANNFVKTRKMILLK